jgi:hypothetical protein
MPFPTQERTFQKDIERWDSGDTDSIDDEAFRTMILQYKNLWQGQSHFGFGGNINEIVAGVTYELVPASRAGNFVRNSAGDFEVDGPLVGEDVEIQNSTSPANDGIFPITAVIDDGTIRYTIGGGVAEAFVGEYRVSRPGAPTARGGAFPSWVCKGSSAGSTGKGAGMDGRDRWHTKSDLQTTGSEVANHSWMVLQNTVNGAEILLNMALNSVARRIEAWLSAELGFTGGSTTTRPTAGDEFRFAGNGSNNDGYWYAMEDWHPHKTQLVFIQSSDGAQDFMLIHADSNNIGLLGTGITGSPETGGGVIPWNGNNTYIIWPDGRNRNIGVGERVTYTEFLDNARTSITVDKDGAVAGPNVVGCIFSTVMVTSAMLGQSWFSGPDKVGRKFPADRIGLVGVSSGFRGRHGYIPDFLFANEALSRGIGQFDSFPGDGSRLWIKIGHYYFPWDGSNDLRRF